MYDSGTVFTAFDTETTSLSPLTGCIIEIGAVKFNKNGVIKTFSELFKPPVSVPQEITDLTGITNEMLCNKDPISKHLPDFLEMIKGTVLVAHNAQFDLNFLNSECMSCKLPVTDNDVIDTLQFARFAYQDFEKHKLPILAEKLGIDPGKSHRATDDAETCRQLLIKMFEKTRPASDENQLDLFG